MSRSEVSVPVATKLFLELAEFLRSRGSGLDPVDAISSAIEFWMKSSAGVGETASSQSTFISDVSPQSKAEGYWWKGVLIPSGSKARVTYKGKTYFADVTDDGFLYDGKSRSPSELTWAITNTARNAWRDIELKLLGSEKWILADQLRRRVETDALI